MLLSREVSHKILYVFLVSRSLGTCSAIQIHLDFTFPTTGDINGLKCKSKIYQCLSPTLHGDSVLLWILFLGDGNVYIQIVLLTFRRSSALKMETVKVSEASII